jgi:hypothetical protein
VLVVVRRDEVLSGPSLATLGGGTGRNVGKVRESAAQP